MSGPKVVVLDAEQVRRDNLDRLRIRLIHAQRNCAEEIERIAQYEAQPFQYFVGSRDPVLIECGEMDAQFVKSLGKKRRALEAIRRALDIAQDEQDAQVYERALALAEAVSGLGAEARMKQFERTAMHARFDDYGKPIVLCGVIIPRAASRAEREQDIHDVGLSLLREKLFALSAQQAAGPCDAVQVLLEKIEAVRALTNRDLKRSEQDMLKRRVGRQAYQLKKQQMRRDALWYSLKDRPDDGERLTDAQLEALAASQESAPQDRADGAVDYIGACITEALYASGHTIPSSTRFQRPGDEMVFDCGDGSHYVVVKYEQDNQFMFEVAKGEHSAETEDDAKRVQHAFCENVFYPTLVALADRGIAIHSIKAEEDREILRTISVNGTGERRQGARHDRTLEIELPT